MDQSVAEMFERVKTLYQEELEAQKVVTNRKEIPISYELISDEWLTDILCSGYAGAEVVGHELDTPDEGVTNRRRIYLTYNQAGQDQGLPRSVFCKASQSLESRFIIGLNGGVEGEVTFYNDIRPLLGIEAPVSLFANVDVNSKNSILVMEDMEDDVEFGRHDLKITLDNVKSQMALLATMHGRYYESDELNTTLRCYGTMEQFFTLTSSAVSWGEACERGFKVAEACIPERFFARAEEIWPATERSFLMHAGLSRTLIHNDPHLKNWYIAAHGEMGLNDWQTCVQGDWSRDLAYALVTSLSVEDRRAWEKELIQYYLDRLSGAGGPAVSFDEAFLLYRKNLLNALAMWTGTIAPAADAPEMQPQDSCLEFIGRISHACDDLDALDSM